MNVKKKSANSGIDALLGFEFQRNCALYLLLNDYNRFKGREFFLSIEHHDDFIYCYRTNCRSNIEEIRSFQAKKLSGNVWKINKRFSEVIAKMLEVGNDLKTDPIPKSLDYTHELTFISNSDIELDFTPNKKEKADGKEPFTIKINEQNNKSQYTAIPKDIQQRICNKVEQFCSSSNNTYFEKELGNIHIQWIDFPRTKQTQIDCLVGLMRRKFPHVSDPAAAVELLLSLFRDVESIYNQGKIISLLDTSKRIEGDVIKKAIDVIETEQKTFELWRTHSEQLAIKFQIPIGIQNNYENQIKNTFEHIKDMSNNEHQIVRRFVEQNNYSLTHFRHDEMFKAYLDDIKSKYDMYLTDLDVFFTILCSFVEYHGGSN